ncbi:MAG: site-2 protease family protein, partial [Myxococcota bacterium]
PPAKVGEVFAETPAAEAGLMPGDKITAIDGEKITYWHELQDIISDSYEREVELEVERDGENLTVNVTPEKKSRTDFLGLNKQTYGMLGIHLTANGTTVAIESPDTPAAKGGIETFDDVLTVDGEPVKRYDEITSSVRQSGGKALDVRMLRRQPIDADYGRFYAQQAGSATVTPTQIDGDWTIGIDRVEMYLAKIEPESPAAQAGLKTGDKILALDGRPFSNFSMLDDHIKNDANKAIMKQQEEDSDSDVQVDLSYTLSYQRDGQTQETTLEPDVTEFKDDNSTTRYRVYVGWGHLSDRAQVENIDFPFFPRMGYAAERSVTQTYAFVEMMITGFVRMAEGRVGTESIGGPIMIGELAAKAGKAGWGPFLNMMALISINLAVINLLPIPVLDGGHLLLYFLEAVKRGPLSYRTRQIAAYIGFVIIVFLMVFAFKNDIERNWEDIVQWLNSL